MRFSLIKSFLLDILSMCPSVVEMETNSNYERVNNVLAEVRDYQTPYPRHDRSSTYLLRLEFDTIKP